MPDSIQDDVKAALESSRTGQQSQQTPTGGQEDFGDFGSPPSEVLPPVSPDPEPGKGPQRGPDGKFLPKQADSGTPAPAPAPLPPVQKAPQALGQPGEEEEEEPVFDPAKPPAAWRPEMKAKWNAIPPDIREEITRREQATAYGVQKLQQHYEPMGEIYNTVAPFNQYFQHIQVDPREYIKSMVGVEQTLRLGNPAQKMTMLISLGDTYGVPLRNALNEALGGKLEELMQQSHQHHNTPAPIPPHIQQELDEQRAWRTQIEDSAAETELVQFSSQPGHEYLEYVREDMADLIESGMAEDYQGAYDLACWRNPQVRPHFIQAQAQAQSGISQPSVLQQRQQAAAQIVPPGQAPLEFGADGPGDTDDIHEAVKRAWVANSGRT